MDDLLSHVADDHAALLDFLGRLETSAPDAPRERQHLLTSLATLEEWHRSAEETILYPLLESTDAGAALETRALAEHARLSEALEELRRLEPGDPLFPTRLQSLGRQLREHLDSEEAQIFPLLRRQLSEEQLGHHGEIWEDRRDILRTGATGAGLGHPVPPPTVHHVKETIRETPASS
jgi:hemerythrin-like domain-containing protein